MAALSQQSGTELGEPAHDIVADIMEHCECNEKRARKLLQWSNNDPEKAKYHHRMLSRYFTVSRSASIGSDSPDLTLSSDIGAPGQREESDGESVAGEGSKGMSDSDTPQSNQVGQTPPPERSITSASPVVPTTNGQEISSAQGFPQVAANRLSNGISDIQKHVFSNQDPEHEFDQNPDHAAADDDTIDDQTPDEDDEKEWDCTLPELPLPATFVPGEPFDVEELIGAMQQGASAQQVQSYINCYDRKTVKQQIRNTVQGFPTIFFAVETNNEGIIRAWVASGGDVNAVHEASKVPLLAFAIMHSETMEADTTLTVATLLSLGASPQVIPTQYYSPFCRDLPDDGPEEGDKPWSVRYEWCTASAKSKLARTANLTQRYYLERASKAKKPTARHRQLATRRNAEPLLGIPYFLIGQTMTANLLLKRLLSHLVIPGKKPLVLVFAGPSGHGKTELARRLGHLLSLELEIVDCTIVQREAELFGPREPYVGSEKGSPLNNFLARKAGEKCIVFLDEFEKTTREIHQALLLPFDNGEYQDRRHKQTIDCSKTIWILATNALDATITNFCKAHEKPLFLDEDTMEKQQLMKQLSKEIKEDFLQRMGPPLTGRITAFLPFLPFSPGEQAVVAHKYLLELSRRVRQPINLSVGPEEQLLGNVRIRIRKDASVCSNLASEYYHTDLGARSLSVAVKTVEDALVETYLDLDAEIKEQDEVMDFAVGVNDGEIIANVVQSTKM